MRVLIGFVFDKEPPTSMKSSFWFSIGRSVDVGHGRATPWRGLRAALSADHREWSEWLVEQEYDHHYEYTLDSTEVNGDRGVMTYHRYKYFVALNDPTQALMFKMRFSDLAESFA